MCGEWNSQSRARNANEANGMHLCAATLPFMHFAASSPLDQCACVSSKQTLYQLECSKMIFSSLAQQRSIYWYIYRIDIRSEFLRSTTNGKYSPIFIRWAIAFVTERTSANTENNSVRIVESHVNTNLYRKFYTICRHTLTSTNRKLLRASINTVFHRFNRIIFYIWSISHGFYSFTITCAYLSERVSHAAGRRGMRTQFSSFILNIRYRGA